MARSEAQKAADARYAKKKVEKIFIVHLRPEEYAYIDNAIKASGKTKADFLRWAVAELEKQNKSS